MRKTFLICCILFSLLVSNNQSWVARARRAPLPDTNSHFPNDRRIADDRRSDGKVSDGINFKEHQDKLQSSAPAPAPAPTLPPPDSDSPSPDVVSAVTPTLGLVTGAFVGDQYPQSLNENAEHILREYQYLGVKWIRVEANRVPVNRQWVYRRLVELAHKIGIKVIIVFVPPLATHEDDNQAGRDEYIQRMIGDPRGTRYDDSYLASLHHYAVDVFGKDYYGRPDAYELGNEPNLYCSAQLPNPELCNPNGNYGFNIGGRTFAWLLRRAWQWKKIFQNDAIIISGGVLNTYFNDETAWWGRFLGETSAWTTDGDRPFDYMGVHPYHSGKLDPSGTDTCINRGSDSENCFNYWESLTRTKLSELKTRMDQLPSVDNPRFFVTEIGWEYKGDNQNCPQNRNCVKTVNQLKQGMQAALNACTTSGTTDPAVDLVLFYNYRNDPPGSRPDLRYFGLRSYWNGDVEPNDDLKRWPAKPSWEKFKQLAQGTGTDPEQAWPPVPCPVGAPGFQFPSPCRKRFYDTNDQINVFGYFIEDLSRRGVVDGVWLNNSQWWFQPEASIDRATFVSWIARGRNWNFVEMLSRQSPYTPRQTFEDVPPQPNTAYPGGKYYNYIESGRALNPPPFSGYPCNTAANEPCVGPENRPYFRPQSTLTRGQASKIIAASWGWSEPVSGQTFQDVPPDYSDGAFYPHVERIARRHIFGGYPCGGAGEPCVAPDNRPYFRPSAQLTRGQTAKIVSNSMAYATYNSVPLGPASGLAATAANSTSVDFRWNDAPGAQGFWLDIAKSPEELDGMYGSFRNYHSYTATNVNWQGLSPGTTYYWRIWAYDGNGGLHSYPTQRSVTTPFCGEGFSGWKSWGAQAAGIGHNIGRADGSDWSANVYQDGPGFLSYGPYDRSFGQGPHTAWFHLLIDNNTAVNDLVATIDVVTEYGGRVLARRNIYRHEFSAAYQKQWFQLNFDNPCFGQVEARVYWHDRAYMNFGFLYINH
jgi:hypothetical protein